MSNLCDILARLVRDEDGPTAVEYAVMLAMIILVCSVGITSVGTKTQQNFNKPALTTALGS